MEIPKPSPEPLLTVASFCRGPFAKRCGKVAIVILRFSREFL
jgi:hypothetical protein